MDLRRRFAAGVFAAVGLAACSDEGGERAAPTATSTSTSTSTTLAAPTLVDGIPQVSVTPARAPIGATVRIDGTGFTGDSWRVGRDTKLWLVGAGPPGCSLYAEADHTVTVSAAGRLTGAFVVPASGDCRMGTTTGVVTAQAFRIAFKCTPCFVGRLEVTTSAARCANVGFTANSDDGATSIVTANLTCAEAEALVRKVGPRVTTSNSARVEVDGFTCVLTGQIDDPLTLPRAFFRCTSGTKTVTFTRF